MKHPNKIAFFLLLLILFSCNKRYKVFNMMLEEIDVTDLVTSGNYLPDSCDGRLTRLIRTTSVPYQIDTPRLKKIIVQWAIDSHIESTQNFTYSSPTYKYTYIINKEPIDVYSMTFQRYLPAPEDYILYFRVDNTGKLMPELSRDSWVSTNCDKE
jgi:hypothetical protein